MRSRAILIVAIIFLAAGALTIYFGLSGEKTETRNFSSAKLNLQSPQILDDYVYYFNGTVFARINSSSLQTEVLSDPLFISQGINTVSYTQDSVVFRSNPASSDGDDLAVISKAASLSPDVSHWWQYDFQTKEYGLLAFPGADQCSEVISTSPKNFACIAAPDSGEVDNRLLYIDLNNRTSNSLLTTQNNLRGLSFADDRLYVIETKLSGDEILHEATISSKQDIVIYETKNKIDSYVASGAGSAVIVSSEQTPRLSEDELDLGHEADQANKAVDYKVESISNNQSVLKETVSSSRVSVYKKSGKIYLSATNGSLRVISGDKIELLFAPSTTGIGYSDQLFAQNDKLYLIDDTGTLFSNQAVQKPAGYRTPGEFDVITDNAKSGNSFIGDEDNGKRKAFIYLENTTVSKQQAIVLSELRAKNFDALEFSFDWVAFGADFDAPVVPKGTVLK